MFDKEILKKLKKLTEKDIERLSNMTELTPDEHRNLKNALTSHTMLEAECDKLEYEDYDKEMSGRRIRGHYDYGHSGHSIHDRAISRLEQMMPEATTEYERQEISGMIDKLR